MTEDKEQTVRTERSNENIQQIVPSRKSFLSSGARRVFLIFNFHERKSCLKYLAVIVGGRLVSNFPL